MESPEETELRTVLEAVLKSPREKKLLIAGPGTGKTTLFKQILMRHQGPPDRRIVLTFINNLKDDLEDELRGLARAFTLHSYCMGLLHGNASLRGELSTHFRCCPGMANLIKEDWEFIMQRAAPQFTGEMRALSQQNSIRFYLNRGDYYDAVDFDDSVYRAHQGLSSGSAAPDRYDLVLVDEYQDFNALEASVIDALAEHSPIVIAGDDDQALYSQLRGASWDHIRLLSQAEEYEVFKLPFCMRCPKVIVDAVNDVIAKAGELNRLRGRIQKPYKHYPPAKGDDSAKYPKIAHVETSVQRQNANYMGRYIASEIARIPRDEIEKAARDGYPAALVIAAEPYRRQIVSQVQTAGCRVDTKREADDKLGREKGLSILKEDRTSNLGWRIVLREDAPAFYKDTIVASADRQRGFVDLLPAEYRERLLAEADEYKAPEQPAAELEVENPGGPATVKVTSFEGAKGLSAQHVYIAGLHDGELPHDPASVKDLEICKFVVGLTRTRKKCTLIRTRNFAGNQMRRSTFISWIGPSRLEFLQVNKAYWTEQARQASQG